MDVEVFLSSREGRAVVSARVNGLLVSQPAVRDAVVNALAPFLDEPVRAMEAWPAEGGPGTGTLIVPAVQDLTDHEQRAMLAWLRNTSTRIQTLSFSADPLFPRVLSGDFMAELYYHLNTVYVGLEQPAGVAIAEPYC